MDAVNNGVVRNILALQNVYAAVFHIILGHRAHGGGSGNLANEGERSQHHADFHRERQISHHGQRQRQQPNGDVRGAEF